jgi:hypothetical protein
MTSAALMNGPSPCRRLSETTVEKADHPMSTASAFQRTPLVISAGSLVAGPVNATFREGDPESLLHSYLILVRRLRGEQREPTITLRSADISALAAHLGSSEERVLDDLLGRMGATRAQRRALAAMFAVGALTIVATGSIALELSSSGAAAVGTVGDTPAAEVVRASPPKTTTEAAAGIVPDERQAFADAPAQYAEPELVIAGEGADWEIVVAVQLLTQALAEQPDGDGSIGSGVADDGSTVAVGRPPVPPVEGVGVADDGSTVAVGRPPVPPVEGVGVADDGSTVAVGRPPVPPVEGVGVADDGSIVAVGTPPTGP